MTFVELIASVAVLSIIAVGLAASVTQAPRLTRGAQETLAAENAIKSILAELSAAPYSEVAATFQGHCFACGELNPLHTDTDGMPGEVQFAYGEDGDRSYYTVTISVGWNGVNGDRRLQRIHHISNILGDPKQPAPLSTEDSTESPQLTETTIDKTTTEVR
jgi:type II secretory pathway pseudopilin PulG